MSLSPLIIGHEGGAWWDSGVCCAPIAGADAPNVKPPAMAALFLRSSLRFSGFEPMRLSFADEANEEIACGREYTPISALALAVGGVNNSVNKFGAGTGTRSGSSPCRVLAVGSDYTMNAPHGVYISGAR